MTPRIILRLEGAAVFVVSLVAYSHYHGGWILFLLLFLIPDVTMMGYFIDNRIGAAVYNAGHTYIGPVLLAGFALGTGRTLVLLLALIWIAHIAFDRLLGFGLKYETGFKDTYLNSERNGVVASVSVAK